MLLLGQLESSRGRLDQAIADFRRAVELAPDNLRARFALAQEIERAAGQNADAEAQQLLEDLLSRRPENLPVLVERTRLAVKRADARALQDSVTRLAKFVDTWPPVAVEQFRDLERAAAASNFAAAAPAIARLRNVLVRVPSFREGFSEVRTSAELIGEPFVGFLRLAAAKPRTVAAGSGARVRPAIHRSGRSGPSRPPLTAFSPNGSDAAAIFAIDARGVRRIDAPGPTFAPADFGPAASSAASVVPLDWNRDYRMDLGDCRPRGNPAARFKRATARSPTRPPMRREARR